MSALIRDSTFGQLVRRISGKRLFRYPEEEPGWQCPSSYRDAKKSGGLKTVESSNGPASPLSSPSPPDGQVGSGKPSSAGIESEVPIIVQPPTSSTLGDGEKVHRRLSISTVGSADTTPATEKASLDMTRTATRATRMARMATRSELEHVQTRHELEHAYTNATIRRGPTRPIVPEKLEDGTTLVDWYDTDDPENPQNWSRGKKFFVTFEICIYTLAVYMGSAIYTPSIPGVIAQFGVSETVASLGLSFYVLAYGIGPMLFSPLSEIPSIGRNPPYMISFALFVILTVPAALVNNFAGLMVLRFLQGFFGSPCLATAGASLGDIYSLIKLPYPISLWALFATGGPALGPIVSGFSVPAENWRWSMWEMLWMGGPTLLLLFFFLPETSSSTILRKRAQRLRQLTGNQHMKSQSEIDQASQTTVEIVEFYLLKPWQITVLDPAVAFTSIYISLCYGIFYSFFEVFPLVYPVMYGFNTGETGLAFLPIPLAGFISGSIYWAYLYRYVEPDLIKNGLGAPEVRLKPALGASFLVPVGLFMFAWLANPSIHWMGTIISLGIFTIGVFMIFQCIFIYLPLNYPQYAASLFAANDFCRSAIAAGAIIFAHPLFANLGVGVGLSILAALTVLCIGGVFFLFFFGANLRARSRFTVK